MQKASSVQFAKINVVLSAKHFRTTTRTVISVIDTVVAGKEMSSEVAGMRTWCVGHATLGGSAFHARAPATGNAQSPSEDRRVAGTTTSVLEAEAERSRCAVTIPPI